VNQFIEECRREWKRLRVPDQVANEMAADLAADLTEAESEGASAEELLGSGAADARSFAESWAAERGVIPPPRLTARLRRRSLVLTAIAALTVITAVGAALAIFASPDASAPTAAIAVPPEFAAPRAPATMAAIRVPPPPIFADPSAPLAVWIKRDGRGVVLAQASGSGVEINTVGSILLIVGIVGIILSLLFLWWSSLRRPGLWLRGV
jgi:hypothetical protein